MKEAMRFDLVDLQLFLHVVEAGSITGGATRAHLSLASAANASTAWKTAWACRCCCAAAAG
jgi:hypothetical protein